MALSCPHILQENGGGILADDTGYFLATESGCVTVPDAPNPLSPPVVRFGHSAYTQYATKKYGWRKDFRNR